MLLAFQRRKQKVVGGAVDYIGIKLTLSDVKVLLFVRFLAPTAPVGWWTEDFSGWFCFGRAMLFCSAQEQLLLFEPLWRCTALRGELRTTCLESCLLDPEFLN